MSTAPPSTLPTMSTPTPSSLPKQPIEDATQKPLQEATSANNPNADSSEKHPLPLLRIHLDDLSHPSTTQFLSLIDPPTLLPNAISTVKKHLYPHLLSSSTSPSPIPPHPHPHPSHPRPIRSITLILRPMPGVASTSGLALDAAHKEILFSLDYIAQCCTDTDPANSPSRRRRAEILGVVTHETVHCLQHDARGTAPSGLIEGVADYVRLKAGLAPPHWMVGNGKEGKKRRVGERWDEGYERTAFFLEWLEGKEGGLGEGAVRRINAALGECEEYEEEGFWEGVFGRGVRVKGLWERYVEWNRGEREGEKGEEKE